MIKYLEEDEWNVIEKDFHPNHQRSSESIFSIGNGRFGQRANFEETYSGDSLQGSYIAGVYYPDKTKVGWWKNGYPEYFAKVLNSVNWIGVNVWVNGEEVDLAKAEVIYFERKLNMKHGLLQRNCTVKLENGMQVTLVTERFCSMANDDLAALKYTVSTDQDAEVRIESYLDADVSNEDTNWDEKFWVEGETNSFDSGLSLSCATKKTDYHVGVAMVSELSVAHQLLDVSEEEFAQMKVTERFQTQVKANQQVELTKFICLVNSMNVPKADVLNEAEKGAGQAHTLGYDSLKSAHESAWESIWETSDIVIEGDVAAQQGIRFNIFHLNQTYSGKDDRLNIGPKGFTGEKYGGSTYWDTEAYCIPFYLGTHDSAIARQLLVYRFKQLDKAIENAEKLGFKNGAALYPMVTMTGEECHNEWEITFEEIHRNGAITFAIYNYVRFTNDKSYLAEYGLDVLMGISRFWAQRVNWSEAKGAYVMLGVTGPNEYENNVNNNWYTNYIARWCLKYTLKVIIELKENDPDAYAEKVAKYQFNEKEETLLWADILEKMYLPQMEGSEVFLQQDGFLDKEQLNVADLAKEDRPINQKWSWDRILRSIFIKQADVLQGMYFFAHHFTDEQVEANFDFYEPKTVHESSLSPCIHVILASRINRQEKAYELYLRTSRLDLDDYNHEAYQGLHITAMAGTWMAVVEGFGGMKVEGHQLALSPSLPKQWDAFNFRVNFRGSAVRVNVTKDGTNLSLETGQALTVLLHGKQVEVY
ncbi:MAG: family 65 glycosyl hydrolase domain-containing protein [Flavobacteriales bacterium]|nr:family 65 glycosyl hydrolase domain-containing protein [Flavobacteriales bacterium]MDG2247169.1 family 65 glycosyl hydrolase domain-containing protein [Flavobacteriales bacterium]